MSPAFPQQPYVGLRPFESHESILFFGRHEETIALMNRLHAARFLAVVGSSGTGKSSLVRAGLIPKLEAGFLVEERDRWSIVTLKPGGAPIAHLAAAVLRACNAETSASEVGELADAIRLQGVRAVLDRLQEADPAKQSNLFLLVDQFEELFRVAQRAGNNAPDPEAADFVAIILELARQREAPIYVTLTMRSDFLGACDNFVGLTEALNRSQYLVPRLTRHQLREAILGPANLFRTSITPRLTDRLLNDLGHHSDELPVLQHALMRTWNRRDATSDRPIDLPDYEAVGTLDRALSLHAEEALEGMSEAELERTRRLFRALTETDRANRRIRRPAKLRALAEIVGTDRDEVLAIIERFRSDGRSFIVVSEGTAKDDALIDISHESLIRQWARLRRWVDAEAESANIFRRLAETARLHQQGKAGLYRDPDLQIALDWKDDQQPTPRWSARYDGDHIRALEFLDESRRTLEEEHELARQAQRALEEERLQREQRTRMWARLFAGVAAIAVLASVAAGLLWQAALRQTALAVEAEAATGRALESVTRSLVAALESSDPALVSGAVGQLAAIGGQLDFDPIERIPARWFSEPEFRLFQQAQAWLSETATGAPAADATAAEPWKRTLPGMLRREFIRRGASPALSSPQPYARPPTAEEDHAINPRLLVSAHGSTFRMGSADDEGNPDERPRHAVSLHDFYMQKHEVTNAEYRRFKPAHAPGADGDLPAVNVSWSDAMAYAIWIGGSLPTEAQWELAARGVEGRTYPWSTGGSSEAPSRPTLDAADPESRGRANFGGANNPVMPAGSFPQGATPEGILDLAGNVWEWCADFYAPSYPEGEATNPRGPADGASRVLRGGCNNCIDSMLRGAARLDMGPERAQFNFGFRVAFAAHSEIMAPLR